MRICTVTTIRAPLKQTLTFVRYHLNIGIDEIILFFDDPDDPAIVYLKEYEQVTVVTCNQKYWETHSDTYWETFKDRNFMSIEERQLINVNFGREIAEKKGCHWIIHIDSDEMIYPRSSLKSILSHSKSDIVWLRLFEAVPELDHYENIFSSSLFRKPSNSIQIRLAKMLGCKRAFFEGEYFRAHTHSKTAVRITPKIVKLGVHSPRKTHKPVVVERSRNIYLLHYDCVSFEAWKTKWIRRLDGSATATLINSNRRMQLELFEKYLEEENHAKLVNLYRELHMIPKSERFILRLLNMLGNINLNEKLFDNAPGDLVGKSD